MSESNNDLNHPVLNLTTQEKQAFSYLFKQADKDSIGVVTGENAVNFFEPTKLDPSVLGEIWQIADTENRGLLTQPGFCMVLRLIGHIQNGKQPSAELAFKPGPLPRFDGMTFPGQGTLNLGSGGSAQPSPTTGQFPPGALQPQLSGQGPIRVPPLDPQKVQQYTGLFDRSGAQNGMLDGVTAKSIFEKAGLPNEVLGRIWGLSDREQRGALDQTEFIVAMHLLTSMKTRAMAALPSALPPGLYEAAARRGAPVPGPRAPPSRSGITPQYTGGAVRTQSPMSARPAGFGTPPPPMSAQTTGPQWLVNPGEKAKYDQFFTTVDRQGRGVITGEQAVTFFSDSGLPEDTLASIWDLADVNSSGELTRDEFAVAMYLIRQQRTQNPPPLPAFLPSALVPPSMRKQQLPPQQQAAQPSTAPAFDNANNTSNMPKSAVDDLFDLDKPIQPSAQQPLQPQGTGASASRDPFQGSQPQSPSSPQRFIPQPQQANTNSMFKPFIPSSQFGHSLQAQNTGGSQGSASGQSRNFSAPVSQQAAPQQQTPFGIVAAPKSGFGGDDLLGDNETQAAESSKITDDTTELANMSSQIGNLRGQMESTQAKRQVTQSELDATNKQKQDLELRLQQFRSQYDTEVRTVKELETQLVTSRESTKKLGQELAMLEGTYQDLSSQHQTIAGQLQADQQENAILKQKISQLNAEVARLKPEIEKMQMDARKERGMVSINKKQLSTNEGERDRLQTDKADLEKAVEERARSPPIAEEPVVRSAIASPASTMSSTNPFFRKASESAAPTERAVSPATAMAAAPTPSAFDTLFGPAFAAQAGSRTGTPPATSFVGRSIPPPSAAPAAAPTDTSIPSNENTPFATTPPFVDRAQDQTPIAEQPPPPPPENRQFTPGMLGPALSQGSRSQSVASSTRVMPPHSRAGGIETPMPPDSRVSSPAPEKHGLETAAALGGAGILGAGGVATVAALEPPDTGSTREIPGAFPDEQSVADPAEVSSKGKDDFDSAFAAFGEGDKAREGGTATDDPFAPVSQQAKPKPGGFDNEFPPIQSLEKDDESDSDTDSNAGKGGFDDDFAAASPPRNDGTDENSATSPARHGVIAPAEPDTAANALVERRQSISESQVRPTVQSIKSGVSSVDLPGADAQQSPPTYGESDKRELGGSGQRTESNQFPPEFGDLLPSREDPTTSPPPVFSPPPPEQPMPTEALQTANIATDEITPLPPLDPSTPTAAASAPAPAPAPVKTPFDEFDDFDDLAEAKEEDKAASASNPDFGFGRPNTADESSEFNPAFDSPAPSTMTSTTVTGASAPAITVPNGFGGHGTSGHSSLQQTPTATSTQQPQDDWDSIFSGLDNSKNVDTSLGATSNADPWGDSNGSGSGAAESTPKVANPPTSSTGLTSQQAAAAQMGRAISPGTEHDDPILKRVTALGFSRNDALSALEKYDYDINRAIDHLTSR